MVLICSGDLASRVNALYSTKRMPFLYCFNRSSGWRILSENHEKHVKGLRSEHFEIKQHNKTESYLTCIAMSEDGTTAIGSGTKEGNVYFIKDMSAIKDTDFDSRFMLLHKDVVNAPIYSIDWSESNLLVGTHQGITKVFNVVFENNYLQDFTLVGQYINPLSETVLYSSNYIANTHVKAAEFSPSYSCQGMDVHSSSFSNRLLLTTTANLLSIWDASEQKAPVSRIYANESPLNCASWSPNDPQSLIVCGGYDRKLIIIDTRVATNGNNGIVWSAHNAHERPIREAKFNPFIPYWLASAGEDSIVNIWDIRASYRAPIAKIDGNADIVTSVAWSNIRPENLGTTASDGTMRYYTLSPESFPIWDTHYRIAHYDQQDTLPIVQDRKQGHVWGIKDQHYKYPNGQSWKTDMWDEGVCIEPKRSTTLLVGAMGLGEWGQIEPGTIYKGEKTVNAKGAVVKVIPSKLRPSMYYSITSGGQLSAHSVRLDATSNLRNRHNFDSAEIDTLAVSIEDDIYCRRINDAHHRLEELKKAPIDDRHTEREKAEKVEFLEDCLKLRESIKCTEWKFDSIPDKSSKRASYRLWNTEDLRQDAIETFKRDLKYWSYRIPPGYNTKYKFPLEFTAPIIAPHLLEEEKIFTPLPPRTQDSYSECPSMFDNDITSCYLHDSDTETNTKEENTAISSVVNSNPQHKRQSIQDRRNMHPVPLIITSNYVDHDPNNETFNNNNNNNNNNNPSSLFTPPFTDANSARLSPQMLNTTNPFETSNPLVTAPEQSPTNTPKSTNPFETPFLDAQDQLQQQRSTNPFDNDSLIIEDALDKKSVRSLHSKKSLPERRHSWISPGARHLSLTLSRHSAITTTSTATDTADNNIDDNFAVEEDQSASKIHTFEKNNRLFKPFKRILSRFEYKKNSSQQQKQHQQQHQDNNIFADSQQQSQQKTLDEEVYTHQPQQQYSTIYTCQPEKKRDSASTDETEDERHIELRRYNSSSRRNALHSPL